ncbi:MAG TPA: hypothetical protein VFZ53_27790, partial [Polyangiaceae bacterium]
MTRPFSALWSASTALALAVSLSSPALAQTDPPSGSADAPSETEETTPESDTKEPEKPAETKPPEEKEALSGEPKPIPKSARAAAVSAVGVEILPGDAYPEPTVRGIRGGSMWLQMHGLQWPYMPAISDEPATRIGFSGSAWVDASYARTDSGRPET